ncbi:tyrosine-type recombinase/integrase [Sulfuritalea hydrogenivorans]|uniref:Phage integrase n=1 Tax=Sulfuritalea hydrogenivorans sk43H TaxID=1223802 RepID=W0SEL6_9PROT|nr:integrase arm-type DNA-binding domain-containing protein [Sulfuritalea hydrogenivorans]BAO29367.1 phage integrase [Sulfuritalea hydrogenivorans sk43H]
MLTELECKNAAPKDKPYRLFDGGGLYLEIVPTGAKYWRLKYRYGGKEKRLAIGVYPTVTARQAREKAQEGKRTLSEGRDPSSERRAHKLVAKVSAESSFEAVAREWLRRRTPTLTDKHVERVLARLVNNLFPWVGGKPIADISAPELLSALRRVEERGAVHTANRLLQYSGQIFRYGIATGRCERDIAADLRGALTQEKEKHRAAITDPEGAAALLRAIDGYHGSLIARCALRLAPLVFVRPGELRHAEWAEIDLDRAEWNIPAEKMKMRLPHLVPLSLQSVAVLREIHPLTGRGRYVFPSQRTAERPVSDNTINASLRRMGFDTREEMTAHGFRAMARTILDEVLGFRPDFIEHQLAHAVRDPNGRAYNRTAHLAERRKMMQAWADYLDRIKSGADVIPIDRAA